MVFDNLWAGVVSGWKSPYLGLNPMPKTMFNAQLFYYASKQMEAKKMRNNMFKLMDLERLIELSGPLIGPNMPFYTFDVPTSVVVHHAGVTAPRQGRFWYYEDLIISEVYHDLGDDSITEFQFVGYAIVPDERFINAAARWRKQNRVLDFQRFMNNLV